MEEPATDDVVADIILLNDIKCMTLFNIGASHLFLSRTFATNGISILESIGIKRVQVSDHAFYIINYCPTCSVRMGDWIILADFLVLRRIDGFDIVLGMDWLSQ